MFHAVVVLVLLVHLAWILFVIVGAYFTRGRPWLTAFHLASLVWGIIVELGTWPCPLTIAENSMKLLAGSAPFHGSFIVHYLDLLIFPDLSFELVAFCGIAVCAVNLAIYAYRFAHLIQHHSPATKAG